MGGDGPECQVWKSPAPGPSTAASDSGAGAPSKLSVPQNPPGWRPTGFADPPSASPLSQSNNRVLRQYF